MSRLLRINIIMLLVLVFANPVQAQQQRSNYFAVIKTVSSERFVGVISTIEKEGISIVSKKNVASKVSFDRIKQIKVYKRRSDVGYTIVSAALITGAIVAAQQINDGNVATLVGIGGAAGITTLSMALHNVIHGPSLKIENKQQALTYELVAEKLKPFTN